MQAPATRSWLMPVLVGLAALIILGLCGVIGLLLMSKASPAPVVPTNADGKQASTDSTPPEVIQLRELQQENLKLESQRNKLKREYDKLRRDLQNLVGSQPLGSTFKVPTEMRALASALPPTLSTITPQLVVSRSFVESTALAALFGVVAAQESEPPAPAQPPTTPAPIVDPIAQLQAANFRLNEDIKRLAESIEEAKQDLRTLRGFAQADLVIVQPGSIAVGLQADSADNFGVVAKAEGLLACDALHWATRNYSLVVRDGRLARNLYADAEVETLIGSRQVDQVRKHWKPRNYVPTEATQMVVFKDRSRKAHRLGFYLEHDNRGVKVALADGSGNRTPVRTISKQDIAGAPIRGIGEELLEIEPEADYLDYVVLQTAQRLSSPDESAYHQLAIRTRVEIPESYLKRLSNYTTTKDVNWLLVAMRDELAAKKYAESGQLDIEIMLEKMRLLTHDRIQQKAVAVGLPVVERDPKTLQSFLEEQYLAGKVERPDEREILSLSADIAAQGGNQSPVELGEQTYQNNQEGSSSRQGRSERRFGTDRQAAGEATTEIRPGGIYAPVVGGYAYGTNPGRRDTYGEAERMRGFDDSKSSENQQYKDQQTGKTSQQSYRLNPQEIVARTLRLSPRNYGSLLHATHVLEIKIEEAQKEGCIRYAVNLFDTHEGNKLWSHTAERSVAPYAKPASFQLTSGELWCVNADFKGAGIAGHRLLPEKASNQQRDIQPDSWLVYREAASPNRWYLRNPFGYAYYSVSMSDIDLTSSVRLDHQNVPPNNLMRYLVWSIADAVKPKAGRIIESRDQRVKVSWASDSKQLTADERPIVAGDRLLAARIKGDAYRMNDGYEFQPLPFDLRADEDQNSSPFFYASYHDEDDDQQTTRALWSKNYVLRGGDMVYRRNERAPRVQVQDFEIRQPDREVQEELGFINKRKPDLAARNRRESEDRNEDARRNLGNALRNSLEQVGIDVVAKDARPLGVTHIIRGEITPTSRRDCEVRFQVFRRGSNSPVLTQQHEISHRKIDEWRP